MASSNRTIFVPALLATFGGVIASTPARADVTVYFDRAEWEAAVGSFTTIDFTGFPDQTEIDEQYADQGVLFPELGDFASLDSVAFPIDGAGIANPTGLIFTAFDEPQLWLAVDFPGIIQFHLLSEGRPIYESPLISGPSFAGLLSDASFDSAIVSTTGGFNAAIDDLHFGVPAPSSLLLFGAGLLLHPRRRR